MKKTQITFGGRMKFHFGPFEVEAIVINDNLGVIFHAYTPDKSEYKINDVEQKNQDLPFDGELKSIWDDIKKDEENKELFNNFPIRLKGLTIATTRFPLLYEKDSEFFKGADSKGKKAKLYVINDKNKAENISLKINDNWTLTTDKTLNNAEGEEGSTKPKGESNDSKKGSPIKFEYPKGLMDNEKLKLNDYDLIPARIKDTDQQFFPLQDWKWEIALDIEVVSTKQKEAVVLNPVFVKDKRDYVKNEKNTFLKQNTERLLNWNSSKAHSLININADQNVKKGVEIQIKKLEKEKEKAQKQKEKQELESLKDKTVGDLFYKNNVVEDILEQINKTSSFDDTEIIKELVKYLRRVDYSNSKKLSKQETIKFGKDKIKDKGLLTVNDLSNLINKESVSIILRMQKTYKDAVENNTNEQGLTDIIKELEDDLNKVDYSDSKKLSRQETIEFAKDKIKDKGVLIVKDLSELVNVNSVSIILRMQKKYKAAVENNTNQKYPEVVKKVIDKQELTKVENPENPEDKIFNQLIDNEIFKSLVENKEKKFLDWISDNKDLLEENRKTPEINEPEKEKLSQYFNGFNESEELNTLSVKGYGMVDDFYYHQMMTPNEKANYDFERANFKNMFIKVKTNQFEDLFGAGPFGVRELQFKFKRTLSDIFRKKLTEIYNNNDVYQSKINKIEAEIEKKEKLIASNKAKRSEKKAAFNRQVGRKNIDSNNNNFYRRLIKQGVAALVKDQKIVTKVTSDKAWMEYNLLKDNIEHIEDGCFKEDQELVFDIKQRKTDIDAITVIYNEIELFIASNLDKQKQENNNEDVSELIKKLQKLKLSVGNLLLGLQNIKKIDASVLEHNSIKDIKEKIKDLEEKVKKEKKELKDKLENEIGQDSNPSIINKIKELKKKLVENGINLVVEKNRLKEAQKQNPIIENKVIEKEEAALANLEKEKNDLIEDKKVEENAVKDSERVIKLTDHPNLSLHPDWIDDEKKFKFPTLDDRVLTALKEFGK